MHDSTEVKQGVSFIVGRNAQKLYPARKTGKKPFRYSETIVMGKVSQFHNSYAAPSSIPF